MKAPVSISVTVAAIATALALLPAMPSAQKPGTGPTIVLDTAKGTVEIETYPEDAPKTVARVVELIKKNFYNGMRFHRAEPNFLVQIGVAESRDMSLHEWWGRKPGMGSPIGVAEITKKRRHVVGSVGMAHAGDPKSAESQFYIIIQPRPGLDGKYTVFGKVVSGMDVVQKIKKADLLKRASVK
jgi:cyclophilin family peptidyl-prolyl cis-trans isomerase